LKWNSSSHMSTSSFKLFISNSLEFFFIFYCIFAQNNTKVTFIHVMLDTAWCLL
jgi:hypothetical protein